MAGWVKNARISGSGGRSCVTSEPYEYPAMSRSGVLSPSYVGAVPLLSIVLPSCEIGVEVLDGDKGAENWA